MIEYERTNLNGVPDYTAVEFEGRRHDYCLLIPVINEGARILTELGRAQKAGIDQLCDIVICDGGSTDGSMKRETLGGGDIKLMAAAGLFLGWQNTLLAMFFGIVFGGMYGIYLLAAKKAGKKDHFAFGPFLCAGIVIAMLFGGPVLEWYCAFL